MPKHGWRWRTEQVRSLTESQIGDLLQAATMGRARVSAKLARWIFETLGKEMPNVRFPALECIAYDDASPWGRSYLWSTLSRFKHDAFGDWVVIALTRGHSPTPEHDALRFIALYEDVSTHPTTRGSAIFGISNAVSEASYEDAPVPFSLESTQLIRRTCASALQSPIPYARAGAGWLAQRIGGFEAELDLLRRDKTPVFGRGSQVVATYADGW